MTCQLLCVDPARNAEFAPYVFPLLQTAIDRVGVSDWESIAATILRGESLIWIAWDGGALRAAACTELTRAGQSLVCAIVACGGAERGEWLPLLSEIEAYAAGEGCNSVRIIGRKAWARVLPDYSEMAVVLEKKVERVLN